MTACSTQYTEIKQIDDKAYIQLTGEIGSGVLHIDDVKTDLSGADTYSLDGAIVARFEVKTGTHLIRIAKKGVDVVKRKIYVTNGNVFEVIVP